MDTGKITFKQIEAFRAVILAGSMTAAADDMQTSQPNVSRWITQLEEVTCLRLFDRLRGRIRPTDEGLAFFEEVQRSFVGLKTLENSAHNIRRFGTGRLRIAASPLISFALLPRVILAFKARNPTVSVSVYTNDSSKVAEWVASRFCDIGLASLIVDPLGLKVARVYSAPGILIMPKGHPLASKAVANPNDLDGEQFVSQTYNAPTRARIDQVFAVPGPDRRLITLETPFAGTICKMVAIGLGISIVNPLLAHELGPNVEVRHFRPVIPFSTYLLLPHNRTISTLAMQFKEVLLGVLREVESAVSFRQACVTPGGQPAEPPNQTDLVATADERLSPAASRVSRDGAARRNDQRQRGGTARTGGSRQPVNARSKNRPHHAAREG